MISRLLLSKIKTDFALIACALLVMNTLPCFLKNMDIKLENKILSNFNLMCILKAGI